MKPFIPKRRYYRRRLITYKRLFVGTLIAFMSLVWYMVADEVNVNNSKTEERMDNNYGK
tara:strand:- start:1730 stop:1906 length:177 start_codon:yes stop_codon:yes gene_type:complete